MTKVEYIESKLTGMVQVCEALKKYYEDNDNSFESLSLDELIDMIRKIDLGNFKDNEEILYECCRNCKEVNPYNKSII